MMRPAVTLFVVITVKQGKENRVRLYANSCKCKHKTRIARMLYDSVVADRCDQKLTYIMWNSVKSSGDQLSITSKQTGKTTWASVYCDSQARRLASMSLSRNKSISLDFLGSHFAFGGFLAQSQICADQRISFSSEKVRDEWMVDPWHMAFNKQMKTEELVEEKIDVEIGELRWLKEL